MTKQGLMLNTIGKNYSCFKRNTRTLIFVCDIFIEMDEWVKCPKWMSASRISEIEEHEYHEFDSFRKWLDKAGYKFEKNTDSTYEGQVWSCNEVPYTTRDLWDVFRALIPKNSEIQESLEPTNELCSKCNGTGNKSMGFLPFIQCECGCKGLCRDPRDII